MDEEQFNPDQGPVLIAWVGANHGVAGLVAYILRGSTW